MVLTRSMATTNDIQEEEPPTTALKKQVRLSPRLWNASPNKIATWKSSCAIKTQHRKTKEMIKREPMLTEETKRDPRPVTPQADRSDRT